MRMRSLLFVPASRPDRFDKAVAAGADVVVLDLEDAVAPEDKDKARDAVCEWVTPQQPAIIRINGSDSPWFNEDKALASLPGVSAIMLPKAEQQKDIELLSDAGATAVLPLIETAAGLANAPQLANTRGTCRLAFGSLDFQVDMGMRDCTEEDLYFYRCQLVLASRLANLPAPIDGVTTAINDIQALQTDTARSKRLGFGGKLCIHPKQVEAVNAGFSPTPEAVAWARKVIAATQSSGLAMVDGKMVDKPVILNAEAILRGAEN